MKKVFIVFTAVSLAITACETDSDLNNCDFDESAMLTNYAENIIIPRFESLSGELTDFEAATTAFVADPTASTLLSLKESYVQAYVSYQRCSSFTFGPGLINGIPFRDRFNIFPTNSNVINQNIAAGTAVSASPQSTVGFPAIEFLIYGDETQVIESFTTANDAPNRKTYLSQLVAELNATTSSINTGWDSYKSSFVSNTGSAAGTSLSELANQFNLDFEIMKNFKFKVPVGRLNAGVPLPDKVEGYYSGISASLAKEQMSSLKEFYLGIGENGSDGLGLDDYLECLDAKTGDVSLAELIEDKMNGIIVKVDLLVDPMSQQLLSNQSVVDDVYLEMQSMVPLVKHEMTSAFAVQINYESGDGD